MADIPIAIRNLPSDPANAFLEATDFIAIGRDDGVTYKVKSPRQNILFVNDVSDLLRIFPEAANVITLDKAGFTIHWNGIIDISPHRMVDTAGVVMQGDDRIYDGWTTDNVGASLTITGGVSPSIQECRMDAPNGTVIDQTGGNLRISGGVTGSCVNLGDFDAVNSLALRSWSCVAATGRGILFTGACGEFNADNGFYSGWVGTMFDLGTATFNTCNMGPGNRFNVDVGTTAISGAALSANINSGGFGLINNSIFTGLGTFLNNILSSDVRWELSGNGNVADTLTLESSFIATGDEIETSIANQDEQTIVAGTFTQQIGSQFSVTAAGLVTYLGARPIATQVTSGFLSDNSVGNNKEFDYFFVRNIGLGSETLITASRARVTSDAANPDSVALRAFVALEQNDTLQLVVFNRSDSTNVTASSLTTVVSKV